MNGHASREARRENLPGGLIERTVLPWMLLAGPFTAWVDSAPGVTRPYAIDQQLRLVLADVDRRRYWISTAAVDLRLMASLSRSPALYGIKRVAASASRAIACSVFRKAWLWPKKSPSAIKLLIAAIAPPN